MTKIEWVARPGTIPVTWNPVTGCTPVSPGCAHCYAKRMSKRLAGRCGYPADDPFRVTLHEDKLLQPYGWEKPRTVFVVSMGDLFHEDVPTAFIDRVFSVIGRNQQHTFMVLTKRAWRMAEYYERVRTMPDWTPNNPACVSTWPLPNLWLGVTAENQEQADKRIPLLLQTRAAVRFVSIEPMLGPIQFRPIDLAYRPGLNWVIVGGETGPGARPIHPDWVRDVRDQCVAAGVPFFFKAWGNWAPHGIDNILNTPKYEDGRNFAEIHYPGLRTIRMVNVGKKAAGRLLDGQTWSEWPA